MQSETVEPQVAQAEELSAFQRIIGVFTSPGKTFASIDRRPGWILPVVLSTIISVGFIVAVQPVLIQETLSKQEQKMQERGMDSDQIDQILSTTEKAMKYTTPAFALIMPVIIIAIISAVFLFVGNVVLGGSAPYKKVLSVTAHSWLIISLGSLIAIPLILAKETMQVSFSLATLMSESARETFLYQLLAKVDVFAVWTLSVLSIGLALVYKMNTKKMATAVVTTYLLYALVASAFSSAFS